MMNEKDGEFLVKFARDVIERFVKNEIIETSSNYPKKLDEKGGVFVTLEENGELRGCIGLPYPEKPIIEAVKEAAISATHDPRFPPLSIDELNKITIEVSVLTEPEKINFKTPEELLSKIIPNKDGLILKNGWNSGLFLPQVWKQIPSKKEFLENLCYKAGLSDPEAWKSSDVYKFQVQSFKEKGDEY